MKTIAIFNLKGGVAKTVTTVNLAAALAHDHGQRVLVVDADSQANTTEFFGGTPEHGCLSKLLRYPSFEGNVSREAMLWASVQTANYGGALIDIIPGDDGLMDLDLSSVKSEAVDVTILRDVLRPSTRYDFVLIDCPPAFNAATAAGLLAADEVIIPVKLDAFSLRGMGNLMRQIENIKRLNPRLTLRGVLPTMYYRSPEIADALKMLRLHGMPVLALVPRSPRVDDMTFRQRPLLEVSPNCGACRAYRRLAGDLMRGGADREL